VDSHERGSGEGAKYELRSYLIQKLKLIGREPTSYLYVLPFAQLSDVGPFRSHMTQQSPLSYWCSREFYEPTDPSTQEARGHKSYT